MATGGIDADKVAKTEVKPSREIKMVDLLVFGRMLVIGFVCAEVTRIGLILGGRMTPEPPFSWLLCVVLSVLCGLYAWKRGSFGMARQMWASRRLDLFLVMGIGGWISTIHFSWRTKRYEPLTSMDGELAWAILALLCLVLLVPLMRKAFAEAKNTNTAAQVYLVSDEEIRHSGNDLFELGEQVKFFADTVMDCSAHAGLVFGLEGPWGVGKTSFINLAMQEWSKAKDRFIVCRFEPLRYRSDPELAERLIRDVSAEIQKQVFAPELQTTTSRYSRLIKGKADISFLGFKLSLEPSKESAEDLLDDIDSVLQRIGRRVIIVIDDLDRLDAKTRTEVLCATKRMFKLSQATYILCYDEEMLVGGKDENAYAREFLEKFVSAKQSLFIDAPSIQAFLREGWKRLIDSQESAPLDRLQKLQGIFDVLAEMLGGNHAADYRLLAGDLRKVKRFVNAMLLMELYRRDLDRTDFGKRDLIHLLLLKQNYPGLLRAIYAAEMSPRDDGDWSNTVFSVQRDNNQLVNSDGFLARLNKQPEPAQFLLKQLFDAGTLNIKSQNEETLRSRACFNEKNYPTLQHYLKLIVRLKVPLFHETFVMYQRAVQSVLSGKKVSDVLSSPDFQLQSFGRAHEQFWALLVRECHQFTREQVDDAIEALIGYLPQYSVLNDGAFTVRGRAVGYLARLLDRAGWGDGAMGRWIVEATAAWKTSWRLPGASLASSGIAAKACCVAW